MNIGISTASLFLKKNTESALAWLGEQGIGHCEAFLDTPSEYEETFAQLLYQTAEAAAIQIDSVHALSQQFEPQLFSSSERQFHDAFLIFKKIIHSSEILGCPRYTFHGIMMPLGNKTMEKMIESIAPRISMLANFASDHGVQLCLENVSWCMLNHPMVATWILAHCNSKNIWFTFDNKQAIRAGYDPFDFLTAMGKRVANVHLCDYALSQEQQLDRLLLPGQGVFDFSRLHRVLRENDYQGNCMLEVYSNLYTNFNELIASYQFLTTIFSEGDSQ